MPPELVAVKLADLAARLARIDEELPASEEAFLADRKRQEMVAFNFLLAVQAALDLAAHLVAEAGWGVPGTARAHFELLADHELIGRELSEALAACAGARNLVAHHYGRLDLARFYRELPPGLRALKDYAVVMASGENGATRRS